ncbi:MAG: hypothetical protein Q7U38_06545 [Methylobacter sp.]|nr:hypothetical protein [Methylobacter sp.]MDP2099871.1 hypothetical protein [Methylobacter sp.]MDP2429290.1 hypothetical protein [Methylobacter sp.]MDP3053198.1 hypothetical protein [Methylobacter sp.]MDP3361855.1 hypothetical protein [Methylobacter sp.]
MLEIQPILPSAPVVRPQKINRDDNNPAKGQPRKKPQDKEKQDAEPAQHIDEIV